MRTLIMTGLMLASMGAAARDMFVVINTRDTEIDVYRCDCGVDDIDCVPVARTVIRSTGSMNWHVVGGVAPYMLINSRHEDHNGTISVTVMDAMGNISTSYATIGKQIRYFNVTCPGLKEEEIGEATPLSIPVQKKPTGPAKARISPSGPVRERGPVDPGRIHETVQPERRVERTTLEVRPAREQPAPGPSPAPRPVRQQAR